MIIKITPNSEPYFVSWEEVIHFKQDSGKQTYTLPSIKDPEGSEVGINIDLSEV